MAYDRIAPDLAATFYTASLLPDPTLDTRQRPKAMEAYRAKGEELAEMLLHPSRQTLIRCQCRSSQTRSGRPSAPAIAAVHDRRLLVVRGPRGPRHDGLRLVDHHLVDFEVARRDSFTSVSVWCYGCGALHDLGFRWLKRAPLNAASTPTNQYQLAPWGDPIAPQGYTPRHPNDAVRLAFAITTGPLDGPEVIVSLGWLYAFAYRDHFGFKPPHEDHLMRLVGHGDPRVAEPRLEELLTPQWRKLQLGQDDLSGLEPIERPVPAEAIEGLARFLSTLDTAEREDELLTLEQLMDRPDFDRLQNLVTEEAR